MGRRYGFTLIELMIVIAIISILAALAIPNLMAARKAGNEVNAIGALKTISTEEAIFNAGDKEGDGNLDYGMLSELNNCGLIDNVLGTGTKAGYMFQVTYGFSTSDWLWFGTANPLIPTATGDRYFAANFAGDIFYSNGASLILDTSTCSLPNNGMLAVGK